MYLALSVAVRVTLNATVQGKKNVKQTNVNALKQSSNVIVDATKVSIAKTNELMLMNILYVIIIF